MVGFYQSDEVQRLTKEESSSAKGTSPHRCVVSPLLHGGLILNGSRARSLQDPAVRSGSVKQMALSRLRLFSSKTQGAHGA